MAPCRRWHATYCRIDPPDCRATRLRGDADREAAACSCSKPAGTCRIDALRALSRAGTALLALCGDCAATSEAPAGGVRFRHRLMDPWWDGHMGRDFAAAERSWVN